MTFNTAGKANIPKSTRFLILEDIPEVRDLIRDELEILGFDNIEEAEGLRSAQEVFNKSDIGFVLLDWTLTDGCGTKFLSAIRGIGEYKNLPILMLTANDNVDDMMKSMEMGASEYLVKPWSGDELEGKISEAWLKHYPENTTEA